MDRDDDLAALKSEARAKARDKVKAQLAYRDACDRLRMAKAAHQAKKTEATYITDHAVLRYLQRVRGENIEAIREHIAKMVSMGTMVDFERIDCETFIAVMNGDEGTVTTILETQARTPSSTG